VILCVCLSPAIDVTYRVDRLVPGATVWVGGVVQRPGGKAVNVAMAGKERTTYPLEAFLDLGAFLEAANNERLKEMPPRLAPFLETHRFHEVVGEIRQNTASPAAFRKRFFRWFDGFMAMKMIHFLRDQSYSERGIYEEAERLKELITTSTDITKNAPELLTWYRRRQQRKLARQPTPPA